MSMEHTLELFKPDNVWNTDLSFELTNICAQWKPPFYFLNTEKARNNIREIRRQMGDSLRVAYPVKTNPWLTQFLADEVEYFTICSQGELELCKRCGVQADKIILDGVLRTASLMSNALEYGVSRFCIDSQEQMQQLFDAVSTGQTVSVLFRISSGNQFGLEPSDIPICLDLCSRKNELRFVGIQYYPGTQRSGKNQIRRELDRLEHWLEYFRKLEGVSVQEVQFGAGLGVPYFLGESELPYLEAFMQCRQLIEKLRRNYEVTYEAGRIIAATSGTYVTQVFEEKQRGDKKLLFCLGGTSHLQYPGGILGLRTPKVDGIYAHPSGRLEPYAICGSLCSEDDILAKECLLDAQITPGDLLIFHCVGAYSPILTAPMFLMMELPHILVYNRQSELSPLGESVRCIRRNGLFFDLFYDGM